MDRDFEQIEWNAALEARWRRLAELALEEDLAGGVDHTGAATVPEHAAGQATIAARQGGIAAGMRAVPVLMEVFGGEVRVEPVVADAQAFQAGDVLAHVDGRARDILRVERTLLNLLGRLSGIASRTRQFVDAVAGTDVRLYDTRKTTPGWRYLEKYAVRCGGGYNHRAGLHAAILIKDNHIASWAGQQTSGQKGRLADLVHAAREYAGAAPRESGYSPMLIEIEVDSLAQLEDVLGGHPDLVLLDNMAPAVLREAVRLRDRLAPGVELEASGGITLNSIGEIASTGIERISVGGLTHQAVWLDIGLDWAAGGEARG